MIDTIKKYKIFDLTLLSALAFVAEVMSNILHNKLPGAGFYLSFSILIAMIAMIRWGKIGAFVYVVAGIPMVFLLQGDLIEKTMLYPVANITIIFASFLFRFIDRSDIKSDNLYLLIYVIITYMSVAIGKGFITFVFAGNFLKSAIYYIISQLFNMVMVFLVLLLVKNKEGLLDDMYAYINRSGQGGAV